MAARNYGQLVVSFLVIIIICGVCAAFAVTHPERSQAVSMQSASTVHESVVHYPHLGSGLAFAAASVAEQKLQQQNVNVLNRAVWFAAAAAHQRALDVQVWVTAYHKFQAQQLMNQPVRHVYTHVYTPIVTVQAPPTNFGNLSSVIQCIKNHESGNYSESSHPGSGSGAYQYIPGTWQKWSAMAGYPGYSLAYLAPPSVQDAVVMYTLTHGGAHNWDPAYGNDPCTVGMG